MNLENSLKMAMELLFGGDLALMQTRAARTAYSAAVCYYLCGMNIEHNMDLQLWGSPHHKDTVALLNNVGIKHIHYEFLNDFVVFERKSEEILLPILACESELHPTQEVTNSTNSGYTWDFLKLLYTQFQQKLFIACVGENRIKTTPSRLDTLKSTLSICAKDHAAVWSNSRISIVLYPNVIKSMSDIVIGISDDHGNIVWHNVGANHVV